MAITSKTDALRAARSEWNHLQLGSGGYTTSLELESKLPEDLVDALYEEVSDDYSSVIAY